MPSANFPATQATQPTLLSDTSPALQPLLLGGVGTLLQESLPTPDVLPAGHAAHVLWPRLSVKVSFPHGAHVAAPAWEAYLPALHATQPEAELEPSLFRALPMGQLLHTARPVEAAYVPAGQAVHDTWLN